MNTQQARVIDPILTEVALGYSQPQLVGTALFPRVTVEVRGGLVLEFGREAWRLYDSQRAPGAPTKRVEAEFGKRKFATLQHSLEGKVPVEIQQDASRVPGVDMGQMAVNLPLNALALRLEWEQAQLARDAANYDAEHKLDLVGAKWTDDDNNPFTDVDNAKEAVRQSVGVEPNTLLLSAKAYKAARNNAHVIERIKYTSRDSVTPEMLAAMWDVERVVVGRGVTSTEQNVTTDIWGTDAILAYVAKNPRSREEPSYGFTYTLKGHPMVEKPYYDSNRKSWMYPVVDERSAEIVGPLAGFLLQRVA